MQNNFEARQIKESKEVLTQELKIAQRHLENYKEIQKDLLKEPTLWEKIIRFFNKYF